MNRTVRLALNPTPEQAPAPIQTGAEFTAAFNFVCRAGWDASEKNGVRLHHATYYDPST